MEYEAWIEGMDPENVAFSKLEIAGDEKRLQWLLDRRADTARRRPTARGDRAE